MRRRVAITGMGVVCPGGNSIDRFLENLLAGVSGVGPISLFDPAELPTRIAAQVKWEGPILRDRKITFGLEAARQAMEESGRPKGVGGVSLGIGLELFSMDDLAESRRPGFVAPTAFQDR